MFAGYCLILNGNDCYDYLRCVDAHSLIIEYQLLFVAIYTNNASHKLYHAPHKFAMAKAKTESGLEVLTFVIKLRT